MLFCQLGRAHSLREICGGLASCEGKLHHLGIASPKRSTLSYANKRPWQLYEKVFYRLLDRCLRETEGRRKRRFRFKNPLLSLDATVIDCAHNCLTGLIFAEPRGPSNCSTLGPQRLRLCSPSSHGRHHRGSPSEVCRGTVVVFDRGYNDWYGT